MSLILALILSILPTCAEEDGSGQAACLWDDGSGAIVLNVGEYWQTFTR